MFPLEIITMGASVLLSFIVKLISAKNETKREKDLAMLNALNAKASIAKQIRSEKDKGVQWTRRIIALSVVFSVIVLPKVLVLTGFYTGNYTFGWTELEGGFLFFSSPKEVLQWMTLSNGLVITPLDTHTVSAIIGLYFGSSMSDVRR